MAFVFDIIDRLPSAMRPPLQRRGHCRSISHGGTSAQASIFHPAVAVKTENYTNILSGNWPKLAPKLCPENDKNNVYIHVTKQKLCISLLFSDKR